MSKKDKATSENETQIETPVVQEKLRYRLLTGKDDRSFCERVSKALDDGYELYGSPSITYNKTLKSNIVAQAVILK